MTSSVKRRRSTVRFANNCFRSMIERAIKRHDISRTIEHTFEAYHLVAKDGSQNVGQRPPLPNF